MGGYTSTHHVLKLSQKNNNNTSLFLSNIMLGSKEPFEVSQVPDSYNTFEAQGFEWLDRIAETIILLLEHSLLSFNTLSGVRSCTVRNE